jgi:hypothetical protein
MKRPSTTAVLLSLTLLPVAGSDNIRGQERVLETPENFRPYSDNSPWNSKIPAGPRIDPDSDRIIEYFTDKHNFTHISTDLWNPTIYFVDERTPLKKITVTRVMPRIFEAPIPIEAAVAPDTDGWLTVYDLSRRRDYGFWRFKNEDGKLTSSSGSMWDLDGAGILPLDGRGRGSGLPYAIGSIMYHEMKAGRIPHVLVACATGNSTRYRCPARKTDGYVDHPYAQQEGMRLQLHPDYDTSALPPDGKIVAAALKEYGVYIVDNGGAFVIKAENLLIKTRTDLWKTENLLSESCLKSIPLTAYRVLARWDGK